MQSTARWLLGVIAAFWFFVPQLTMLRKLVPAELPLWVLVSAVVLVLGSAAATVFMVFRVQTGSGDSINISYLDEADLAYVQGWGLMTDVETSERWRAQTDELSKVYERARYTAHSTPPITRQRLWHPDPPRLPVPEIGEALWATDTLARMARNERDAAIALAYRDVKRRFDVAKWTVLVGSLTTALGILILVGPPTE